MKFKLLFFLLLSIFLTAQTPKKLTININGNTLIDNKLIYDKLNIKGTKWYEFYKKKEKYIDINSTASFKKELLGFYRTEGFFKPNITISQDNHNFNVRIKENRFLRVSNIKIDSDIDLKDIKFFKVRDRFAPTRFVKLKRDIQKSLLSKGYCNYTFDNKAFVDLDTQQVNLEYKIKKNRVCKFGKVTLNGLKNIKDEIILSRLNIKEGDRLNIENIKDIYINLQNLNVFDEVLVDYSKRKDNIVPIDISLKEKERAFLYKLGLGYDTNLGFRLSAFFNRLNFLSDAKKLSLNIELSRDLYSIESKLFIPTTLFDYTTSLGYRVEKYSDIVDVDIIYSKFNIIRDFYNIKFNMGMGFDYSKYGSIDGDESLDALFSDNNLFLLYPYFDFTYDRRDSKLNPKNGYYISGAFEYAIRYNDDSRSYNKMLLEGRYIKTINDYTLSSVTKVGFINPIANITPDYKKFFAGGSFSNRAYGYNEIGVTSNNRENLAIGGLSMANLSLEVNKPIVGDLSGALFSDISMVSDKKFDLNGEYITTVGAGVRYNTPIAPIKIDMGVNVNNSDDYGITFQLGQSF